MKSLFGKHIRINPSVKNIDVDKAIMESKYLQFVKTIY